MAHIKKRKSRWFAQVNRAGVRKSRSFGTRAAAKAWAEALEEGIRQSANPHADITLAALIDRYTNERGALRPWGRAKSQSLATLRRAIGSLTVRELSVEALVNFATARAIRGAGPATVLHDIAALSPVLRTARLLWGYPIPPTLVADARYLLSQEGVIGQAREVGRDVRDAELARLEANWPKASPVPVEILRFAVASCLRRGELLGLRRADYNPTFRTVVVRNRKHPTRKQGNDQVVPLLGEAATILAALPDRGDRLWPYTDKELRYAWEAARKAAELEDVRWHDLRHTGITRLRREGWGVDMVAIVSGHRSWKSLKRYDQVSAADMVELDEERARVKLQPKRKLVRLNEKRVDRI